MTFYTDSPEQTIEFGKKIGSKLKKGDILAMQGTLAAGKTTITKGIAIALGVEDTITSPTFCLISEYEGKLPLYHMDVYRLNGTDDFIKIMDSLPKKTIIIRLEPQKSADGCRRKITLENWPYGDFLWGKK